MWAAQELARQFINVRDTLVGDIPGFQLGPDERRVFAADVPQRVADGFADVLAFVILELNEELDGNLRMITKIIAARPDAQALGDGPPHVEVRVIQPIFDEGQSVFVTGIGAIAIKGLLVTTLPFPSLLRHQLCRVQGAGIP